MLSNFTDSKFFFPTLFDFPWGVTRYPTISKDISLGEVFTVLSYLYCGRKSLLVIKLSKKLSMAKKWECFSPNPVPVKTHHWNFHWLGEVQNLCHFQELFYNITSCSLISTWHTYITSSISLPRCNSLNENPFLFNLEKCLCFLSCSTKN